MERPFSLVFTLSIVLLIGYFSTPLAAQMITGTWKGRINSQKVEIKIIQKGDSLTGTSYYYESANNYRRYSIEGYFDPVTNSAVWWDDQLLDEKKTRLSIASPGKIPMLSRADFNCPGNREMTLDGRAAPKDDKLEMKGIVHLDKISQPDFEDEWDFVIDNYITGANDPDIIDSIAAISSKPVGVTKKPAPIAEKEKSSVITKSAPPKPAVKTAHLAKNAEPVKEPSIEEKFVTRQKRFVKEIPVSGDSIELRFYDNAEIDGDSISLFLNDKLIFEHIRLTGNAFIFKIPVNELKPTNELTMVAENMGTIPPNTSYMVAIVNEIRYDAYLASTEGSSAMIRFTKK